MRNARICLSARLSPPPPHRCTLAIDRVWRAPSLPRCHTPALPRLRARSGETRRPPRHRHLAPAMPQAANSATALRLAQTHPSSALSAQSSRGSPAARESSIFQRSVSFGERSMIGAPVSRRPPARRPPPAARPPPAHGTSLYRLSRLSRFRQAGVELEGEVTSARDLGAAFVKKLINRAIASGRLSGGRCSMIQI